jgi:hypothetical protein
VPVKTGFVHRYLMSRLSLQVFYLWRHVSATAPPFILWWSNLEILFALLHRNSPFIGGLRCQAIQTEHGLYIAERTQKAVHIVRCLRVCLKHALLILILKGDFMKKGVLFSRATGWKKGSLLSFVLFCCYAKGIRPEYPLKGTLNKEVKLPEFHLMGDFLSLI